MATIQTGLERLMKNPHHWLADGRVGLLCNPASVDRRIAHARDLLHQVFGERLKALYSPQHGFFAEKQDNMVESTDLIDPVLQIPVFSLYGKNPRPGRPHV